MTTREGNGLQPHSPKDPLSNIRVTIDLIKSTLLKLAMRRCKEGEITTLVLVKHKQRAVTHIFVSQDIDAPKIYKALTDAGFDVKAVPVVEGDFRKVEI